MNDRDVNLFQDSKVSFATFASENLQVIIGSTEVIEFLLKNNCSKHYGSISL